MRTDEWLISQLNDLWEKYFADVKRANEVKIKFGRNCWTRLGSIRLSRDRNTSTILINGLFQDFFVPEEVVLATIAHELVHYAHGFSSPLQKIAKYPHQGGLVKKELESRGLDKLMEFEKKWVNENWREFAFPKVKRRRRKRRLFFF